MRNRRVYKFTERYAARQELMMGKRMKIKRNPNERMNKTYLSLDLAESQGFIHRDYLAHCLRWSHVVKIVHQRCSNYGPQTVLDVGCGREFPLAKALLTNRLQIASYDGVDPAPPTEEERAAFFRDSTAAAAGMFNFHAMTLQEYCAETARSDDYEPPNVITCLEMLEHVTPLEGFKTLLIIGNLMRRHGARASYRTVAILSTPQFDLHVGAADNHVCEWAGPTLQVALAAAGLRVVDAWGTFASKRDYADQIDNASDLSTMLPRVTYDRLAAYYCPDVLACLVAPLFPGQSRNTLLHLAPEKVEPGHPPWEWLKTNLGDVAREHGTLGSAAEELWAELQAEYPRLWGRDHRRVTRAP